MYTCQVNLTIFGTDNIQAYRTSQVTLKGYLHVCVCACNYAHSMHVYAYVCPCGYAHMNVCMDVSYGMECLIDSILMNYKTIL